MKECVNFLSMPAESSNMVWLTSQLQFQQVTFFNGRLMVNDWDSLSAKCQGLKMNTWQSMDSGKAKESLQQYTLYSLNGLVQAMPQETLAGKCLALLQTQDQEEFSFSLHVEFDAQGQFSFHMLLGRMIFRLKLVVEA